MTATSFALPTPIDFTSATPTQVAIYNDQLIRAFVGYANQYLALDLLGPAPVGLFTDIATLNLQGDPLEIKTGGWTKPGYGGATYILEPAGTSLPAWGNGIWWTTSANGDIYALAVDQELNPLMFGAKADNVTDDSVAFQNCIKFNETVRGRGHINLLGLTYKLNSKIITDPTRTGINGQGGKLNFSGRPSTNPANVTNIVPDPNFNNPNAWKAGTLSQSAYPWVIGNGKADHTTPEDNLPGYYNDFGYQDPNIQATKTYSYSFTVSRYVHFGNASGLGFRVVDGLGSPAGDGIGYGSGAGTGNVIQWVYGPGTYTGKFTTPSTITPQGGWVEFQTQCDCTITNLSIIPVPDNDCLLVQVPPGGAQYGTTMFPMRDFEIAGSGNDVGKTTFLNGLAFDTFVSALSARGQYTALTIHDCNNGIRFGNRVYAIDFYGCEIYNTDNCVISDSGTIDSGEQIGFYGCTLFNSGWSINNMAYPAMEFRVFGGSMDYNYRGFLTGQDIKCYGTHFEGGNNNRPFVNNGGDICLHGCRILMASGFSADYLFWGTSKFSFFYITDCDAYNWQTTSGYLMGTSVTSGPSGRLMIGGQLRWGANHNVAGKIKNDTTHNLLGGRGGFEYGNLLWWQDTAGFVGRRKQITSQSGPTYITQGNSAGNGTLTGAIAMFGAQAGTWRIKFTAPTTFKVYRPDGTLDGTGVTGLHYLGQIVFIINVGSAAFAANDAFTLNVASETRYGLLSGIDGYGALNDSGPTLGPTLTLSTASFNSGTKSLLFTKTGYGNGSQATWWIAIPVKPRSEVSAGFAYSIPAISGASGQMYCQANFASIIGYDKDGFPVQGGDNVYVGELDINASDITNGIGWKGWSFSTTYADGTSPGDGLVPEWATHITLNFNPINMPANFQMYVDDVYAYGYGG